MRKTRFLAVVALLGVFLFGASGLGVAQDAIKIGAYLPMTGGVAAYGDMEWSGIQIAHDMEPTVLGKEDRSGLSRYQE